MKQQRMRDLEDTLYFVLDEKGHSVHLTDRGAEAMSPDDPELFLVPDISEAIHRIDKDPDLTPARPDRAAPRGRGRVRAQEREAPHHPQAAAGARPVREGSGLPGAGRPGADRGRVHRPHHGRPPLGRRPAPGGRGQGAGAGQGRDPDVRHDHDPELLPDVRQAGRHDGHRRDRGDRVLLDLRPRGERHPDPPADPPRRPGRPDLQDPEGEARRDHRRGRAAARARLADPDRHGERGHLGDALAPAQAPRPQARGAEREVPPARGGDRGRGGAAGGDHDRDQHGRPRHRHQTRQGAGPGAARGRASRSSAPSGTSRAGSTASSAAARAARAIRGRASSSSRSRTT